MKSGIITYNEFELAEELEEKGGLAFVASKDTYIGKVKNYSLQEMRNALESEEYAYVFVTGYKKLIPKDIVRDFKGKLLNVHLSLLPMFSGKGMYGDNILSLITNSNEEYTGITIHEVEEEYDNGKLILQSKIKNPFSKQILRQKLKEEELILCKELLNTRKKQVVEVKAE